jgi:hypothetical protein
MITWMAPSNFTNCKGYVVSWRILEGWAPPLATKLVWVGQGARPAGRELDS